ncbi:BP28 C-terminal domain [Trinorchestia longiramus]|nr:BP28 C-terminal domain [Trinorchestia longiramus]
MSLLQQQLDRLAAPQTNVYQDRRKKPSLLYDDPALAESFSRDHFFDVGISGFTELLKLNSKFAKYSHLFSAESKHVQRFIADANTNKVLDEAIEGFLMLLSPYFLTLRPALKAMEWLLQRYAIHEMNVDAVMMCILPYYESPLFLRTVKVLNLEQSGRSGEVNRWAWLVKAQQSGQLLVKNILYDQWLHSGAFRVFCNKFIKKVIKVHDRASDAQHAINFFATTMVGGVSRMADLAKNTGKSMATEDHVMRVLQELHVWLQAPFNELVCGAYLVVMQLAMSLQLQPQVWDKVAALLIKHRRQDLGAELCVCLVAIYHQQAVTHMGAAVLERLQDTDEELQEHLQSLSSYLSQYHLNDAQSYAIIRNVLETAVYEGRALPPQDLRFYLSEMLENFERSFPGGYDKAIAFFQIHADTPSGSHYTQVLGMMNSVTSKRVAASLAQDMDEAMEVEHQAVSSVQSILVLLKQSNQFCARSEEDKLVGSLAHSLADACIHAVQTFKVERHPIKNAPKHEKYWLQLAETGVVAWDLLSTAAEACLPAVSSLSSSTSYVLPPPGQQCAGDSSSLLLCVKLLFLLHFKKRKAQSLLKKLFKRVGDESSVLRLLALVGGWQPHMTYCSLMTPPVKVMCLESVASLLEESPSLHPVALHQREFIIPSVISALSFCDDDSETQRSVRTAAASIISVLKSTSAAAKLNAVGSYAPFVNVIEKHSKGVFMDTSSEYLVSAMSIACEEDKSVLPLLLSAVTSAKQPPHLAAVILFSLAQLQSKSILESLLPVIQRLVRQGSEAHVSSGDRDKDGSQALDPSLSMLLYWSLVHLNSESVKVLDTDRGWQVISTAFQCNKNIIKLEGNLFSPQGVIAEQVISHELFCHMHSSKTLGKLWALMAAAAADFSTSQRKVSRVQRALRAVSLHARFVLEQVQQLHLVTTATSIKESQAKRMKMDEEKMGRRMKRLSGDRKQLSKPEDSDEIGQTAILPSNWRRLRLLLELVCEVESVTEPWLLVEVLCGCLHEGLGMGPQLAEQVVPQVLACLYHLVNLSIQHPPKNAKLSSLVPLNIEAVVQCIRQSGEPFTHRQAFLVLTLAAKIHPEAVLHNLMTIFTFMGAGLLQRDDHFSYQVIETTVNTLVPILIQRGDNSRSVGDVVQVFVDALPDISVHRRLLIFRLLTVALGPSTHLWLVLCLTIKTFAQNGHSRIPEDITTTTRTITSSNDSSFNTSLVSSNSSIVSDGRRPGELSFILRVCEQFCVEEQVAAVQQVLALLVALPTELGGNYKKSWIPSHQYVAVLKLNMLTGKQLRHFIYTSVGFLVQLFSSENFLATLVPVSESSRAEEQQKLQHSYCQLLTVVTSYLHTVTSLITRTQNNDAIACKFWSALQRKLVQLQEGVCAVLQSRQLLSVVSQLIHAELAAVKLRSLELLRTRLLPSAAFFSEEDSEALLQLLPTLQVLGCNSAEGQDVRQAALCALQLLLSFLGSRILPEQVLPVLQATVDQVTPKGNSPLLVMQTILVVAECVGHVKNESIAVLPRLMPTLLGFLAPPSSETDLLPLSAATALYKVIENVPKYITRYLPELLVRLCRLSWLLADKDTPRDVKICAKLAALGASLRHFIEPQVFLPHLLNAYNELSAGQGTDVCCVVGVLELLEDLVAHFDQSALRAHHADLVLLLKRALGTRLNLHSQNHISTADIDTIEWRTVTAVTRVVLGQDEASNIKLISSIVAWTDENDSVYSRIALYRLVQHLASTLQVLFIKARLADQVFDHAVAILASTSGQSASREDASSVCLLLSHVLASFTEMLKHDSVGFTTDTRFKMLMDPIVLQMRNTVGGMDKYKQRVRDRLRPCLVQLCSATRNDALWADLNRQVLMLLREDLHPEVHVCVLGMMQGLVEELREAWLQPLLADTLPYVTEAMESQHAGVEEAARHLLALMEDIMGDAVREQLETHLELETEQEFNKNLRQSKVENLNKLDELRKELRLKDETIADLEGQVRDLLVHLDASTSVVGNPELVGASVALPPQQQLNKGRGRRKR